MAASVILRDATSQDAASIAQIHTEARIHAMPWLAVVHSLQETQDWIAQQVLPHQRVRVAIAGDQAVGFSAATAGWLEQLYILPAFQKQGIGSVLFADVCAAQDRFQFWVFQRNTVAREFYEKHRARLLRLTDGSANEENEPDALYELTNLGRQSQPLQPPADCVR